MNERVVVFATCYVGNLFHIERYERWLRYHRKLFPKAKIVLVDDGSDLKLLTRLHLPIYETECFRIDYDELIIHFEERLGRPFLGLIPGWYRSFSFMAEFAVRFNVDRLIHIESDSFVLSRRLKKRLLTSEKWASPYSREMMGGETAIQVIPRRSIPELWEFWKAGKKFWYGYELSRATYIPEYALPIEMYWTDLNGGRFGEDWWTERIPIEKLDYVVNVSEVSGKRDVNLKWKIDKFFEELFDDGKTKF